MPLIPPLKFHQSWLIIAAGSILLAGLSSITTVINTTRVTGQSNWREALFVASIWLVFTPLTWIPYKLAQRFPLRMENIVQNVVAHVSGAILMCVIWGITGILLVRLITTRPPAPFMRLFVNSLLANLTLCGFLYFTVLGCFHAFSYYREAREREAREALLSAQVSEARLSALRMQLNPHFLFNSLNAITVLVRDHKNQEASRMLELLGRVLRQVLQSEKRQEVTLEEELEFIERYLAIEQVRFSDRLKVIFKIEPVARGALVPTFILQPLVENAIRHGISQRTDDGLIEIEVALSDNDLLLAVKDNGPGYTPGVEAGVGLANTHARLETLFGDHGHLEVSDLNGLGTVACIRLPLRQKS